MKRKIAILGYYHGPKLGIGVYLDKFMAALSRQNAKGNKIIFYTNHNTLRHMMPLSPNIEVVTPKMLNIGSLPAILWVIFCFPLVCLIHKCRGAVILQNPVVLFPLVKTISVIHDLNEFEIKNKYGRVRTFYRRQVMLAGAVANSAGIVAVSHHTERQIFRHFPRVDREKVTVINNGVEIQLADTSKAGGLLTEHGLDKQRYYLVVGRLDPIGKNLYRVLELYRLLRKRRPGDKLALVGGINDSTRSEAERFLDNINNDDELRDCVQYLGYVDEAVLSCLYQRALAVIFMSRFEGFGFPLIEAFKLGCPVIYNTDCQVLQEHAEGAGFPVDEKRLSNGLPPQLEELFDPGIRDGLKQKMALVGKKYDWDRSISAYINFLDRVIGES